MSPAASVHLQPFAPIVSEDGQTKLKLQFDVKEFKPEEVKVKLLGPNTLQVCAEHQEKAEDGSEVKKRLYVRQYQLPKGVEVEHLKPSMTKDGVLTVEAPAPSLAPAERLIPVEYKGDDASQH
jgi:HSP20 family molecular chaperone IbpA